MLVIDKKITMSPDEWETFRDATFAPWQPRTIAEFNAMCDLGVARHMHENIDGNGWLYTIACDSMKFGPNGEVNFPIDHQKIERIKRTGKAERQDDSGPNDFVNGLRLV